MSDRFWIGGDRFSLPFILLDGRAKRSTRKQILAWIKMDKQETNDSV
ncbi:MAG: hypothetical protein F6K09_08240 [Merismopedia sp. SIO2A8]|nr:hypothetical protein [Merismopedia sp. SIO2A8]